MYPGKYFFLFFKDAKKYKAEVTVTDTIQYGEVRATIKAKTKTIENDETAGNEIKNDM